MHKSKNVSSLSKELRQIRCKRLVKYVECALVLVKHVLVGYCSAYSRFRGSLEFSLAAYDQ